MTFLSRLLPGVGSGITIPLLIITLIVMGGQLWQKRDDRLVSAGRQQCDATWQVASAKAQIESARRDAERAYQVAEERMMIMEGLNNDLEQTRIAFDAHKRAASSDPRCLSDGVLDILRKRGAVDGIR